jgi:hypothetical protein
MNAGAVASSCAVRYRLKMAIPQRGDRVPHFSVARLDGTRVNYADLWQRRNLLLVRLPAGPEAQDAGKSYAGLLTSRGADWAELDADIVITTDAVPGVPAPGVVVADRWGEVHGAWHEPTADRLPSADDLVDWLRYIQQVCPECQGEAY